VQRVLGAHADAGRQLGRVDLADDVGELCARRQPFGVAVVARPPRDGNLVGRAALDKNPPALRDRAVRVVMQRNSWVVEIGQGVVQKTGLFLEAALPKVGPTGK
jgi:hypothetical protein